MSRQLNQGHDVYLLTLTKGGATKQRHKYGYTVAEMGDVRLQEMNNVCKILGLTGMNVLDLPDSGLKEMDPRDIEVVIEEEIKRLKPNVVVTYPVHGISGFHDHLVSHAVVKQAYLQQKRAGTYLRRLAFHTMSVNELPKDGPFRLNGSSSDEIDCIIDVSDEDIKKAHDALDCYVTFRETIEKTNIKNHLSHKVSFEIFQESFAPPITDLFARLIS